jgi:hypothetical protein
MREQSFNKIKKQLNESDIEQIIIIVTYRCGGKTRDRVRSILTYSPSLISEYGILDRLIKDDKGIWQYFAGQSYIDEIRTVRKIILNG